MALKAFHDVLPWSYQERPVYRCSAVQLYLLEKILAEVWLKNNIYTLIKKVNKFNKVASAPTFIKKIKTKQNRTTQVSKSRNNYILKTLNVTISSRQKGDGDNKTLKSDLCS